MARRRCPASPRTGNSARALGPSNRSMSAGSNRRVWVAMAVSRNTARMSVTAGTLLRRPAPLLLVALDRRGVAHVGLFGVLTGVALRPPLTEQVPALVEGHLDRLQAGVLGVAEALHGPARLQQALLLGD